LLSTGDVIAPNMQTFYAILDGNAGAFNAVPTPITRSNLTQVTDVTKSITLSATSQGWYYDLGTSSGIGWRVVVNPIAYNGFVIFSALLTSGNACTPAGNSEVYVLNYTNAKSDTQASSTDSTIVAFTSIAGDVTSERIFSNPANNGNPQLIVGSSGPPTAAADGGTGTGGGTGGGATGPGGATCTINCDDGGVPLPIPANLTSPLFTRILNWREIPTAE
jgi:type IV pilus assembly protein PilY1